MKIYVVKQYQMLRNFAQGYANLFYKPFFFVLFFAVFYSCKDPNGIGLEVQPQSEKFNVNTGTSNNFISYSLKESAQRSDETSQNLLGSYNDPIFGNVKAGFLTQFILAQNAPDFGSSPTVDSVVLSLPYLGYYGNYFGVENKQRFRVYQITKPIYKDSVYYSNIDINNYINSPSIADTLIQPDPINPVTIEGNTLAAQLRIKLDNSFGETLMNPANAPYLNTSGDFLSYFYGLYVTVNNTNQTTGAGAVYNFDLLNSETKVTLYFKNTAGTGKFSLIISSDCARVGVFETDYSSAIDVSSQLADISKGQQQFYLQSMGGLKGKIELPVLKSLKDSMPLAINQAEITFKVKNGSSSNFSPPARLYLTRINADGSAAFVSDQAEGDAYYGGIYNAATQEYTFNMARYFQQVISEKYQDYGLYLLVGGSSVTANRVVLNGGDQIKIKMTYTKL